MRPKERRLQSRVSKPVSIVSAERGILAILLLALVAFSLACRLGEFPFREQYAKFRSIKPGMTEEQVRKALGEPTYEYSKGISPDKYCVPGWVCDRTEITHKLLIYKAGEPIAYVYFDTSGKVEHAHVGGS